MMKTKKYYKVGISGHRDLLPSQIETNLTILKAHLLKLKKAHPNGVLLLTPLADGADRLAAKAAFELGISYDVILPMPKALYIEDFSKSSKKEFDYYLSYAKNIQTIKLYAANTYELISKPSIYRDYQYRQVGREIVDIVDEMIIMSDGMENNRMGGTQDIANYAKAHGTILYNIRCDRSCA